MLRLTNHILRRQLRTWDRASQVAFVIGTLLLIVFIALALTASPSDRPTFLVVAGAVLLVTQGVVLWANRGMVTPLAKAQRAYLAEDYETVIEMLEPDAEHTELDVKGWMLLGSAYRQLNRFDRSLASLENALRIEPNHHFSLYNFGRTLLVQGDYAAAVPYFEAALQAGAPEALRADLAEALYRTGENAAALEHLHQVQAVLSDDSADPARRLWVEMMRFRLGDSARPDRHLIKAGLPYWAAAAERFQATPYGAALREEIAAMTSFLPDQENIDHL